MLNHVQIPSANVTANQCEDREQNAASQYNGNERCGEDPYNICMCCHNKFKDHKCLKFLENNYDSSKSVVERALSFRFRKQDMAELICNLCHRHLHKIVQQCLQIQLLPPSSSHISTHCHKEVSEDVATIFNAFDYNLESSVVKRILLDSNHKKIKMALSIYVINVVYY